MAAVRALPDDKGNSLTGTQRDALLLLAATGLRLREGLCLTWSEVDLKAATLTLGADRMKGGRAHALPIPRRTPSQCSRQGARQSQRARSFPGLPDHLTAYRGAPSR